MDSLSKCHFLSSEDEVELAWSNNKVEDVHHADFKISLGESPINNIGTTSLRGMAYHSKTSSRVKCYDIVQKGKATNQSSLGKFADSQGLWWVVGYHFLQVRLLALWKLIRKLDFIDLRKEFYLI